MLSAFSWLYSKIIDQRNSAYKSGKFKTHRLSVPVISVGNITVGGTGKTPLVSLITEILAENGEDVCVISRGYKRKNENERVLVSNKGKMLSDVQISGDEPFELAQRLIGKAIVIADADRVGAGKWAIEEFGITAIVLDDAFQHQRISRDLDIVVIDATNPFGNEKTLPTGILRESLENLTRADMFVITRANISKNLDDIENKIREYNKTSLIISGKNKTEEVVKLDEYSSNEKNQSTFSKDLPLFAFCALGNPNNFFDQLKDEGFDIKASKTFRDHHSYKQKDIDLLYEKAREANCKGFLTTAKDAVKLDQLEFKMPCYVAKTKLVIPEKEKLRQMIDAAFRE